MLHGCIWLHWCSGSIKHGQYFFRKWHFLLDAPFMDVKRAGYSAASGYGLVHSYETSLGVHEAKKVCPLLGPIVLHNVVIEWCGYYAKLASKPSAIPRHFVPLSTFHRNEPTAISSSL